MGNDDPRSIGLLAFDEKTETWYINPRNSRHIVLNRDTLDELVGLYNSVHSGNPLELKEAQAFRRLEETNRRMSETIRELCHQIDRDRKGSPRRFLSRFIAAIRRRILGSP